MRAVRGVAGSGRGASSSLATAGVGPRGASFARGAMSWQRELEELRARERMARAMGGEDKIRRQHAGGRLTVRERIDHLVDPDSFHEIGAIAGKGEYDAEGAL